MLRGKKEKHQKTIPTVLIISLILSFVSFFISPLYTIHLRHRLATQMPQEWSRVTNNGPYAYVSPFIVSTRNYEEGIYSNRVVQIIRYGFPYDPYSGKHSLRSWFFDCLMFYPLAPFVFAAGGNIHFGYILAHATLGTLWVFFFYSLFFHWTRESLSSIVFALYGFFFLDCSMWIFESILPSIFHVGALANSLFFLAARALGEVQFLRLPTPGMTYLWLYATMFGVYLLISSLSRNPRWIFSIILGILLGLLAWAHFYEWTFGVGSTLFFFLCSQLIPMEKNSKKNLYTVSILSLAISVLYYFLARHLTQGVMSDVIKRMGTPHCRKFLPVSLFNLLFAGLFFYLGRKEASSKRWFWIYCGAQEATVFLLANSSLILGYDMMFMHYFQLGSLTVVLGVMLYLSQNISLLQKVQQHANILIAFLFLFIFVREKSWSDSHFKLFGTPQDVSLANDWIKKNIPPQALFVSLSGVLTEFLPQAIPVRFPVTNGTTVFASPVSTFSNLTGMARIIKTLKVNRELFLKERWQDPLLWERRKDQDTYLSRNYAWKDSEHGKWPWFLLAEYAFKMPTHSPEIQEIESLSQSKTTSLLKRPFYLWLQKGDEKFLTVSPTALGGQLIYQNSSVKLYYFSAQALNS